MARGELKCVQKSPGEGGVPQPGWVDLEDGGAAQPWRAPSLGLRELSGLWKPGVWGETLMGMFCGDLVLFLGLLGLGG